MTNTINPPKKRAANIKIDKLHTFEGHPFKVLDNEDMDELTESTVFFCIIEFGFQDNSKAPPLII